MRKSSLWTECWISSLQIIVTWKRNSGGTSFVFVGWATGEGGKKNHRIISTSKEVIPRLNFNCSSISYFYWCLIYFEKFLGGLKNFLEGHGPPWPPPLSLFAPLKRKTKTRVHGYERGMKISGNGLTGWSTPIYSYRHQISEDSSEKYVS